MLHELRSQQDLILQLNEYWLLVQDDHKKRAKQLEVTFDKNNELEKKINQLQDEKLNFRAKQRQADWSMSHQDTQSAEQQVNQKLNEAWLSKLTFNENLLLYLKTEMIITSSSSFWIHSSSSKQMILSERHKTSK